VSADRRIQKTSLRPNVTYRLALSHNRLSEYSLDPSFSMLNRLRYLNLKGNKLKMLPQCVCISAEYEWVNRSHRILLAQLMEMPSLEILDVSRNEIEALPEEPGRLVQLRVRSSETSPLSYMLTSRIHRYFRYRKTDWHGYPDAWSTLRRCKS
jgi:hypothetical protein